MFQFTLHQVIFVYAGLCIAVIAIAVALHSLLRTRRERAALRLVLKCGFCAFEFRDDTTTTLPRCPRCHGLVERRRLSGL
jgi:predicted Zn-ribbon and HTH transcriptional regulator